MIDLQAVSAKLWNLQNKRHLDSAGRILTADAMNAHNTFEKPDVVKPAEFKGIEIKDGKILTTTPSKSVVVLEVE